MGLPLWLRQKLHLPREMDEAHKGRHAFTERRESHAGGFFFPGPLDEAAILTMDGVGEWTPAGFGTGRGRRNKRIDLNDDGSFRMDPLGFPYCHDTVMTSQRFK